MKTLAELERALVRDGIAHQVVRAGDAWMLVTPGLAARVLGVGIGEENLLWTAARFPGGNWSDGGNAGGARTWIAPEGGPGGFFYPGGGSTWEVPAALDPGTWTPCPGTAGVLSFRTEFQARASDGARFTVRLTRRLDIEAGRGPAAAARIRISQEIENAGSAPIGRRASPWCIVQVPSDVAGTVAIGLRPGVGPQCMVPYFGTGGAIDARARDTALLVNARGGTRWKLGVPAGACAGTVSFVRPSRLQAVPGAAWTFVGLRFAVDHAGTYLEKAVYGDGEPADGDAVQAYNDPGTGESAFSEIEAHAPACLLPPGGMQQADVEMTIAAGTVDEVIRLLDAAGCPGLTPSDLSW